LLADVHAHLDMPQFKDLDEVLERAEQQGVKAVISNGVNPASNRAVLKLSEQHSIVKPALGVYPDEVNNLSDQEFEEELAFIESEKPVAIGECGLDYKVEADRERMKHFFEKQVMLAKKLGVPLIVHSRKAELDVVEILESFNYPKVVMHCFTGRKALVDRVIRNDWYFSIPCIVVKLEHFQNVVRKTPLSRLLTETDAPFLSPYPNVSRNEPAFVVESVQKIAELKGLTVEETANQLFLNYQRLF